MGTTTTTTTTTTTSTTTTSTTTTTTTTVLGDEFKFCPRNLPAMNEWQCSKNTFSTNTICIYKCPDIKKAFRKKCICRKDRACKWNSAQVPRCLREDQNVERFMANDFVRPSTPERIEIEEEIEEVELEMISRINEEERKAANSIEQIAQNHNIRVTQFPLSQPVKEKEADVVKNKPSRGRNQARKEKPTRGRANLDHLEQAASHIQNTAAHLVPEQQSDIRTLQHEGTTYIHPFDFFQKLQRWMYEMGLFNYSPQE